MNSIRVAEIGDVQPSGGHRDVGGVHGVLLRLAMFSLRADIGTWAAFVVLRAVFRALGWRHSVFEYTEGRRRRLCC